MDIPRFLIQKPATAPGMSDVVLMDLDMPTMDGVTAIRILIERFPALKILVLFLEAASFSHGSVLNVSNVARECGIERKVVEGYVHILEDLLLAFRLPVFTRRAKRMTIHHPKFYFYDTGLYNFLRPSGPLDRPEEIGGAALEGHVAQHLRAWIDYRKPGCRLYFWRTSSGSEVDFIVYGKDIFQAIEVKNRVHLHPQDLRPLRAFGEDYPEAERILIYRGREKLLENGILIEPCEEFLFRLN